MFAKGLAQATGIAMVGVNHIEVICSRRCWKIRSRCRTWRWLCPGGHTALFAVEDFGRYRRIGRTRD